MSTLVATTVKSTTIQDSGGNNSSTTAQIYQGRAKGWVNFNGQGTVAIRADFNVNSITDNSTGNYTISWSTSFSNANYMTFGNHSTDSGGVGNVIIGAPSTGSAGVRCGVLNAWTDPAYVMFGAHSA